MLVGWRRESARCIYFVRWESGRWEARLRGRKIGCVVEDHQLIGPKRQDGKRAAIAISELNFARPILVDHYNSADLTTAQKQSLTALEVLRLHVLQQGNHVMHFDFADHGLKYIAS